MNGDQEIEAPARARPLSALTRTLGGGGTLPGSAVADRSRRRPAFPDDATPEVEDFQRYADCLDKARPEDTDALQRCAELLRTP